MDDTLKPCRWCFDDLGPFVVAPDGKRQVICSTCGARGPYETITIGSHIEAWNTRTRDPKPEDREPSSQELQQALVDILAADELSTLSGGSRHRDAALRAASKLLSRDNQEGA